MYGTAHKPLPLAPPGVYFDGRIPRHWISLAFTNILDSHSAEVRTAHQLSFPCSGSLLSCHPTHPHSWLATRICSAASASGWDAVSILGPLLFVLLLNDALCRKQARPTKEAWLQSPALRHTGRMHFAPSGVSQSWTLHIDPSQSKSPYAPFCNAYYWCCRIIRAETNQHLPSQVHERTAADRVALVSPVFTRGWLFGSHKQACGRMLQPLGRGMLAAHPGRPERAEQ